MRKVALCLLALTFAVTYAGVAYGATVNVSADDFVTVDGIDYVLITPKPTDPGPDLPAGAGLMWEWDANKGEWKACICRMVAFRALQAIGQYTEIDDITSAETSILTG